MRRPSHIPPTHSTNIHHDTRFGNHGNVKNRKKPISQEQNPTFY